MATYSEYKGNPMIILTEEGARFPFQFGLGKAVRILENLEEIKAFVAKNAKTVEAKNAEYKAKLETTIAKEQKALENKSARLAELKKQAKQI